MSASLASPVDLDEAYRVGRAAAERAADGESDLMTNLVRRGDDPYVCEVGATPLTEVANRTRTLPDEFIGADGRDVTAAFRRYALPLLGQSPFFGYERM
jgi:6-phosphofructokinase 1